LYMLSGLMAVRVMTAPRVDPFERERVARTAAGGDGRAGLSCVIRRDFDSESGPAG
jgi:hypothetical protein